MKGFILCVALLLSSLAHAGSPVIWGPSKAQILPAQLCFADTTCMSTAAGSGTFSLGSFGSTPAASGASFASDTLTLQPADATHPGSVSIAAQTFGGDKIMANDLGVGATVLADGAGSGAILQVGEWLFAQAVVNSQAAFTYNAYYDGNWKRKNAGYAMGLRMNTDPGDGSLMFGTAASGAAGSTFADLTPRLTVRNNGDVGINTNSPSAKLDVDGTVRVRDLLRLPVQAGGSTPTCATEGNLALTSAHILCVCDGAAWKKVSDGSTGCTF